MEGDGPGYRAGAGDTASVKFVGRFRGFGFDPTSRHCGKMPGKIQNLDAVFQGDGEKQRI